MNYYFDERGKYREVHSIKLFEKPPRKQVELELFSVSVHIPKLSERRTEKLKAPWGIQKKTKPRTNNYISHTKSIVK